ncbi:MAG TPA: hypothetical protein VFS29_11905 [Motilibacteraceae bacterium]|nr:hypothetical protein [Motilibacteraceae bacterium]
MALRHHEPVDPPPGRSDESSQSGQSGRLDLPQLQRLIALGESDLALQAVAEHARRARVAGDLEQEFVAAVYWTRALFEFGQLAALEPVVGRLAELADAAADPRWEAVVESARAIGASRVGDLVAARAAVQRAISRLRQPPPPTPWLPVGDAARWNVVFAAMALECHQLAEEMITTLPPVGPQGAPLESMGRGWLHADWALLCEHDGDQPAARRHWRTVVAATEGVPAEGPRGLLCAALSRMARAGLGEDVGPLPADVVDPLRVQTARERRVVVLVAAARAAAIAEPPAVVEQWCVEALEVASRTGMLRWRAEALRLAAPARRALGRPADAQAAEQALEAVREELRWRRRLSRAYGDARLVG